MLFPRLLRTWNGRRWSVIHTRASPFSSSVYSSSNNKPKAVFLNASRLDYDHKLDFSAWHEILDVHLHDADRVDDPSKVLELVSPGTDIVITKEMPLPASTLEQFPKSVRLLCEAGTGYNNLPVTLARQRGVTVCNTPTYSTDAVAHMAITYLLNFSVSMFQQQAMLLVDDRSNFTGPFSLPLHEVNGKTLGLVGGSGRIGTTVAKIGLALGMNVIVSSRQGALPSSHDLYQHPRVICTSDLSELLPSSDYVSIHTPLNDETRHSFGRAQMEQMKASAFLINTSRGAVIHESELIDCLQRHVIAGAGLDVTDTEPPSMDSPLWTLPNAYLSPHTGWRRRETRQRLIDMSYDNLYAFVNAQSPDDYINVVN